DTHILPQDEAKSDRRLTTRPLRRHTLHAGSDGIARDSAIALPEHGEGVMATMIISERDRPDRQTRTEAPPPRAKTARLGWVDAIRAFLAILVVVHHAGQPYGGDGVWPVQEDARSDVLGVF